MLEDCEITLADGDDVDGILDVQERDLPDRNNTLSARFSRA